MAQRNNTSLMRFCAVEDKLFDGAFMDLKVKARETELLLSALMRGGDQLFASDLSCHGCRKANLEALHPSKVPVMNQMSAFGSWRTKV